MLIFIIAALSAVAPATAPKAADTVLEARGILDASETEQNFFYDNLANLHLEGELPEDGGYTTQILALFGREDLISERSSEYRPVKCAPAEAALSPIEEIAKRAAETSIVIINESHTRTRHRAFTAEVAKVLRSLGYDIFAAETFGNPKPPARPAVSSRPDEPFFRDMDGWYVSEASYGRLGRVVKTLGYDLVAYEDFHRAEAEDPLDRIHAREQGQVDNLMRAVFRERPDAKVLIHVGYGHAAEEPGEWSDDREARWMATRLKAETGIDPLTVSQTVCRGNADQTRLSTREEVSQYDLLVDHPSIEFLQGRPAWRAEVFGDHPVPIPAALLPEEGWHVIEAYSVGEPEGAVPMDRVAVRPGEDIALMLPPGRYEVRAVRVPPEEPEEE